MDIFYILLLVFFWGMVLLFSIVPGIFLGVMLKGLFGFKFMFYVGFVLGVIASIIYVGRFMWGNKEKV